MEERLQLQQVLAPSLAQKAIEDRRAEELKRAITESRQRQPSTHLEPSPKPIINLGRSTQIDVQKEAEKILTHGFGAQISEKFAGQYPKPNLPHKKNKDFVSYSQRIHDEIEQRHGCPDNLTDDLQIMELWQQAIGFNRKTFLYSHIIPKQIEYNQVEL